MVRSVLWLSFFGAILGAWALMLSMVSMSGVDWLGRPTGMNMMPMETLGALFPMWAVMMAAMMMPTLVPTLSSYEGLMRSAGATRGGWIGVLGGYMAVWVAAALAISALQAGLIASGVLDRMGRAPLLLSSALLIAVGLYQFTALKEVCHGVCHSPTLYFVGRWRPGASGGARMGAGLGAFCVGCCWGYMLLGFVGGTMSLAWMAGATVLMILEKVPQVGHRILRPVGAALTISGLALGAAALY